MPDGAAAIISTGTDTFPKLLLEHAANRPNHTAMREKEFGIWQSWSWAQALDEIRAMSCGLAAMGFKQGDRLAIIGDNRPHLYWAMTAVQALGGVPVPIYQDSVAEEMSYILNHAEARFALVEDQEQVDKVLSILDEVPVDTIIYDDPRGMRNYTEDFLHSLSDLQGKGRDWHKEKPDFFEAEVKKGRGSDVSVMLYTSGTTGRPKGTMLTFDNVLVMSRNAAEYEKLSSDEDVLAYLPMAWAGDHVFSFGQQYATGFTVNCPESAETVLMDLRELGPTYFFAPPRIFENILTTVAIRMEDAGRFKRWLYKIFMDHASKVGIDLLEGRPVSGGDRFKYWLGEKLIYGPLKNVLGFTRIRIAYTAGEAIGPDIFNFFRALGINIKQIYGMTEGAVFVTIQPSTEVKSDTVGKPVPGVELKIADNGEVVFRSPGVFKEYFKNDEATAEAKTDGWFHTGDAGVIDELGHLKIIDRAKDVGKLTDGSLFAPKYIENKLKFFPFIKEAVAIGDGQDYVSVMINIDLEAAGNWAERRNLAYTGYTDLAGRSEIYDLIKDNVEQVNRDLANDPNLSGCQIKKFLVLHKELDADDGELTRTRKVRRKHVGDKYKPLIDALYTQADSAYIETEVTFEDGRKGMIKADLKIEEAAVTAPTIKEAAE
ncbi:MAG: AMP-binding protein [Pseudomonadota bacterium]